MHIIDQLMESKLLSSTSAYKKYSAKQIAELLYIHILGLRILASEHHSQKWSKTYAQLTTRFTGFAKWYQNATDMHLLLYALIEEDVSLKLPESSKEFKETLYLDTTELRLWLKDVAAGHINETRTKRLFLKLDGQLRIKETSLKAIRRLVQDWPSNNERQKQLSMTRLLQIFRVRGNHSDILHQLELLADELNLELKNVDNQETGDEASSEKSSQHHAPEKTQKPTTSLWKQLAAITGGAVLGYHTVKSLTEEDGGTVAADIAPNPTIVGTVQRRNIKKNKKPLLKR